MNVAERTRLAFTRVGLPDRVPIHAWLGMTFIQRTVLPRPARMTDLFHQWIDDPLGTLVKWQADLGLDPMITTHSQHIGELERWPRLLCDFKEDAYAHWREEIVEIDRSESSRTLEHRIHTPAGEGAYSYRMEGYSDWPLDYLIKDEADLDLLHYRPDPDLLVVDRLKAMVEKVGDRAWWLHHAPGPWNEAAELRGVTTLSMDLYDRPEFVHKLMRLVTDRLKKLYRKLGETGIHSVSMNETWVGMGLSPHIYQEFIKPYDDECVAAIHEAGYLVSYHNCGRGTRFLEDMVATGADALETITPVENSGDFDLADVKRRVGDRICLFGGFNERLLDEAAPAKVRDEVKRCLDAAGEGGGYILRTSGAIYQADPRNIEVMCQTARDYGRYPRPAQGAGGSA